MGKEPTPQFYSKAYSTATEQASLDCASRPCWRRLCRVGKKASQAGHECISSKETVLRSEDTLEEESDERERLEVCETFFCSHKSEICCAIFFFWIAYIVIVIKGAFCNLLQPPFY